MFVLGDRKAGSTIYCYFDTYDSNGASVTITGLAVTDIEIYKNGSVTQRSSDNGYALLDTDGIDFDSTTGLHGFSVDLSDNSDSGFFADDADYLINVNAITVDSQTVRFSYHFTIGKLLRPTTAGRTLDVSSGGEAGVDWANVGSPTTTVNLSGTTVKDATDVNSDTDTLLSRMGTPSNLGGGASLAANLSDIEAQTDDIGVAGAGLTDLGGMSTAMKAQVESEANDALVALKLDHLVAVADADDVADNSIIAKMAAKGATADWSSYVNTTDSLEALRDRGDAAWTTATGFSTHSAADVWAAGTRTLTAGTNIALAKGTGVTGFNDLSAAQVNAEADTALSDWGKTGFSLAAAGLDAVLVESSISAGADLTDDAGTQLTAINARQALALVTSACAAVLAGAEGLTITFKPAGKPSGNTRISATVDGDNNRDAIVLKVPT